MSRYKVGDLVRHSAGRALRLREDPYTLQVENPAGRVARHLARQTYGTSGRVFTIAHDGTISDADYNIVVERCIAVIGHKTVDGTPHNTHVKFAIYRQVNGHTVKSIDMELSRDAKLQCDYRECRRLSTAKVAYDNGQALAFCDLHQRRSQELRLSVGFEFV